MNTPPPSRSGPGFLQRVASLSDEEIEALGRAQHPLEGDADHGAAFRAADFARPDRQDVMADAQSTFWCSLRGVPGYALAHIEDTADSLGHASFAIRCAALARAARADLGERQVAALAGAWIAVIGHLPD